MLSYYASLKELKSDANMDPFQLWLDSLASRLYCEVFKWNTFGAKRLQIQHYF